MINVDKKQNTSGATRSKQVAIFISDSDSLIRYCTRFSSSPIQDYSQSAQEIKIKNLGNFWIRLQAAHDGLPEKVLRAILADVENIINMRPLTSVPLVSLDSEVLTPNFFLFGNLRIIRGKDDCDVAILRFSIRNFVHLAN